MQGQQGGQQKRLCAEVQPRAWGQVHGLHKRGAGALASNKQRWLFTLRLPPLSCPQHCQVPTAKNSSCCSA